MFSAQLQKPRIRSALARGADVWSGAAHACGSAEGGATSTPKILIMTVNSNSTLPDSTPQPLVRRETRPSSKERSANKTSLEPKPHPGKRTHKRGKRSQIAIISHKCGRRYRRSINRREYRRARQCWKALAKLPYTLSEAQERILAEERFRHISLENQCVNDQHNEREAGDSETQEAKTSTTPTTKSKTINRTIRIATFNVRGMNFITGRQQILYLMEKHNLDILA